MANQYFSIDNECLKVSGQLRIKQANSILENLNETVLNKAIKTVDFSGVDECDTTAVLVLLNLKRHFSSSFELIHVPEKLLALLQLSNLTNIFKVV